MATQFRIIEAPSILGLSPSGVETLPEALLDAGLANLIGASEESRLVKPPIYNAEIDPKTGVLNAKSIAEYSKMLSGTVEDVLANGEIPLVLGGDCSILLGCLLALKRHGRYGLLFLDAHADFYLPGFEPTGEAASMDLAFATGRGPEIVANIDERRPLVRDEDVVVLGRRDGEEAERDGSPRIEDAQILMFELADIRSEGIEAVTERAVNHLSRGGIKGFWLHLDADVLSDDIMPAVDYRLPDGLSFEELEIVLRRCLATGQLVGVNITIFNPKLDADGTIALSFVRAIAKGLKSEAAP